MPGVVIMEAVRTGDICALLPVYTVVVVPCAEFSTEFKPRNFSRDSHTGSLMT